MQNSDRRRIKREPKYCLDNSVVGDSWRMFRIMSEFVEGFDALSAIDVPAVTIYGSARTAKDNHYYKFAEELAGQLAEAAGLKKGSSNPKVERVAEISREKIREIAEIKLPDLNAYDIDKAMRIIAGTARSIGITVIG